jgi:hypothetical protein
MESQQRLSQLNKLFKNLLSNQLGVESNLEYDDNLQNPYILTIFVDPNKFYQVMGADTVGEYGESEYWGLMNSMEDKINNIIKYIGMEEYSVRVVFDDKDLSGTQKFIEGYIKSNFNKVLEELGNDWRFDRNELPKLEEVRVYRGLDNQPHLYIDIILSGKNRLGDRRIIYDKILEKIDLSEFYFDVDFQ